MKVRDRLRAEAKKIYKQQVKGVPRSQRIPFSQFFKNYVNSVKSKNVDSDDTSTEDFDFDDLINTNEISEEE